MDFGMYALQPAHLNLYTTFDFGLEEIGSENAWPMLYELNTIITETDLQYFLIKFLILVCVCSENLTMYGNLK